MIHGIPHDSRIVNVKLDAVREQIEVTIQSPAFKPEDEKKLLSLIVHEMAH